MALSLKEKIEDTNQGVYLIGTTPPKIGTDKAQLKTIAEKLLGRLHEIEYDGVIIYDIQDESSRTNQARPFAFKQTVDPREYSHLLRNLSAQDVITYKSVAQRGVGEFKDWLSETKNDYDLQNVVLVGSPSSVGDIKLSLPDAYKALAEQSDDFFLGGVTIAERHSSKRNEHERLIEKTAQGCKFFISQAVYDAQATIELITSYARTCKAQGITPQRIILTFTPCGGEKTLEFMQWLGISVPEATKWRMLDADNTLSESVRICRENLDLILKSCAHLDVPLGLNIESLTNRKEEIDASINLYRLLKAIMELNLAEKLIA
ncbi:MULTISPECIES: methylenetetrahydrofolate reductase [unclassified Pseudoalteromonas]|uniref:methylenetetrahydrofolate reductase n=1 Tax=unclassified Pseudoalteromonas TaxID=194690 RepID=UPI00160349E3|nr:MULTISPECIES: methylenetetrahydrofolate reductase [unclassified Pseudoalteromonas]MBB1296025.1 methylenetetrahydrofolate reductase [Pseudoalteromonas sp. SR41-7]MBB1324617.1 methylenetetrahydrofolate reductase [Pseudoalteromonas sp. SR45-1]MBB1349527.1 methylenetetrahydrofolate reductase [Pseudoalteromonas sp. SG45-3]MBB1360197.1 methylenetetrahydrofolate reductase [Pseudoalteromonas sp. SG45-6]